MQFQRPPVSEIPDTVEDWDLSFARKEPDAAHPFGKMRWRLGSNEWICNKMFGDMQLNGCEPLGSMRMRGRLMIDEDGKAFYKGGG